VKTWIFATVQLKAELLSDLGTDGGDKAQAQAFVDTWEWGDEAEAGLAYIFDRLCCTR
jgi:hypothetical protein